jgi:hypothetical protein
VFAGFPQRRGGFNVDGDLVSWKVSSPRNLG